LHVDVPTRTFNELVPPNSPVKRFACRVKRSRPVGANHSTCVNFAPTVERFVLVVPGADRLLWGNFAAVSF
jgi:hypothetical protein